MRRRVLLAAALAASLLPAAVASGDTSHKGWPKINGDLKMHKADQDGELRATKLDKHNELLGGNGDDAIYAGNVGDVLWGDYKPGGQPTTQVDHIHGGPGRDFIYASHGANFIYSGGGRDEIHAHFGRGAIYCSPKTILYISHRSQPHYHLHGCTRIRYKTPKG
jgi:Ca2+-binding RTX toxin-like protein